MLYQDKNGYIIDAIPQRSHCYPDNSKCSVRNNNNDSCLGTFSDGLCIYISIKDKILKPVKEKFNIMNIL